MDFIESKLKIERPVAKYEIRNKRGSGKRTEKKE